jgi:hypothetical protein
MQDISSGKRNDEYYSAISWLLLILLSLLSKIGMVL